MTRGRRSPGSPAASDVDQAVSGGAGRLALLEEVVACGALAGHVREIVTRRRWLVAVRSLPAVLRNRPEKIVTFVITAVLRAQGNGRRVAVACADGGTYGVLDDLCQKYGVGKDGVRCLERELDRLVCT